MEIRKATTSDIREIVDLLKLSLGDGLMPKSEKFWKWKHLENPFGESYVLLGFDKERLIGVRAFMHWQWRMNGKVYSAVRAVDTATDPEYQGQGVFRKLTVQLRNNCTEDNVAFIFNTPNEKSKPGYLKMGWSDIGRLPINVRLFFDLKRKRKRHCITSWDQLFLDSRLEGILLNRGDAGRLVTNLTPEYLRWRYQNNPNIQYKLLADMNDAPFILVYRLKEHRGWTEVRIVELVGKSMPALNLLETKGFLNVISISGLLKKGQLPRMFIKLPIGPGITIHDLNLPMSLKKLNFKFWEPSLGDLEVF